MRPLKGSGGGLEGSLKWSWEVLGPKILSFGDRKTPNAGLGAVLGRSWGGLGLSWGDLGEDHRFFSNRLKKSDDR